MYLSYFSLKPAFCGGQARLVLSILMVCVSAQLWAVSSYSTNIIPNPGFEQGSTGWILDPPNCQVVTDCAHSGQSSLRIRTDDPGIYKLTYVTPPVVPGRNYSLSCWIKTENVTGSGASLLMSIYSKKGRWLADVRTARITGTSDWTLVTADCDNLRADAGKVYLYLLMERGCTGTVWFDDVSVEDVLALRTIVRHPVNWERVHLGVQDQLVLGIGVADTVLRPKSDLGLKVSLSGPNGKTLGAPSVDQLGDKGWENVRFSLRDLSPGDYSIVARLVEKATGATLDSRTINFSAIGPEKPAPKVRFDEYGRCLADGELFFPLGFFDNTAGVNTTDLDTMAAMRMNCILNYQTDKMAVSTTKSYLDAADSRNLKIIFSVKDCLDGTIWEIKQLGQWTGAFNVFKGLVDTFKDHPAVLAWYTNDEQVRDVFLGPLQARHDYIRDNDPNHPVYQVFEQNHYAARYLINTLDVSGADCYPVLTQCEIGAAYPDLYRLGELTKFARMDIFDARPVWMVQECCSQQPYMPPGQTSRPPTYEEIVATSYLSLINGARGILFFEYALMKKEEIPSQFDVMTKVGNHLEKLIPFGLAIDAPLRQQVTPANSAISALARRVGSELYVLAVNPSASSVTSNFVLGADIDAASVTVGLPGEAGGTIGIQNGYFTDAIEAFGTRIYRLSVP